MWTGKNPWSPWDWIYETVYKYSAPLYVDIRNTVVKEGEDQVETQHQKTFIGKIPIMLRSTYCLLNNLVDSDLTLNACTKDPGGYFIIIESEKVFIALEKMATNIGKDADLVTAANNGMPYLHRFMYLTLRTHDIQMIDWIVLLSIWKWSCHFLFYDVGRAIGTGDRTPISLMRKYVEASLKCS